MIKNWGEIEFGINSELLAEQEYIEKNEALMNSIRNDDEKSVFNAVENGADVSYTHFLTQETPLMLSMELNNIDMFDLLISLGANVNQKINDDYSLIWETLWQNKMDFFKILIGKVNKNTRLKNTGKTILMEAVTLSNLEAVQSCVFNGFNVNEKDNKGNTALHYALSKKNMNENDKEIVKFLISYGADVLSKNANGNKPEDVMFEIDKDTAPQPKPLKPKTGRQNKKTYTRKYTP